MQDSLGSAPLSRWWREAVVEPIQPSLLASVAKSLGETTARLHADLSAARQRATQSLEKLEQGERTLLRGYRVSPEILNQLFVDTERLSKVEEDQQRVSSDAIVPPRP